MTYPHLHIEPEKTRFILAGNNGILDYHNNVQLRGVTLQQLCFKWIGEYECGDYLIDIENSNHDIIILKQIFEIHKSKEKE